MTWRQLAAGAFAAGMSSVLVLLWRCSEDDGFLGLDWLPVELTKSYWTPVPQLIWSSVHEGWRSRATLLEPLSEPESHLFTSNLLFMVTRLDVDGERVLLAVFTTLGLEESPSHDKADCPVGIVLDHCGHGSAERLFARRGDGDGEGDRHVAVHGKGHIWRMAPEDFIAFRDLAVTAEAEIGEITSYTVASGEDCTPVLFFIYPVTDQEARSNARPPSLEPLLNDIVSRAAMIEPIYRDIHGDTTGDAGEGYTLLRDVDINAYTISCRKLARAESSSAGSGKARNAMPGELPEALHELLGLAQEWPADCDADNENEDETDIELRRATVARVERIRSWALELQFAD